MARNPARGFQLPMPLAPYVTPKEMPSVLGLSPATWAPPENYLTKRTPRSPIRPKSGHTTARGRPRPQTTSRSPSSTGFVCPARPSTARPSRHPTGAPAKDALRASRLALMSLMLSETPLHAETPRVPEPPPRDAGVRRTKRRKGAKRPTSAKKKDATLTEAEKIARTVRPPTLTPTLRRCYNPTSRPSIRCSGGERPEEGRTLAVFTGKCTTG